MSNTPSLLPCPFCGSTRLTTNCMTPDDVACLDCDALATNSAAWNRRTPQPTAAEFALQALVAAGHVSQELVDKALALPGAPQPVVREPLTTLTIAPVRRFLADRGIYLSDETTKELIVVAHGITQKGGSNAK